MSDVILYLGNGFIIIGLFFVITAQLGIKRMYFDLLAQVHAAGIADAIGFPLCFIGIGILNIEQASENSTKCFVLAILSLVISPVITHSFAKSYFISTKQEPDIKK